jgi:hypothetical protein
MERVSFEKKPSIKLSHEREGELEVALGWAASKAFICLEMCALHQEA